MTEAAKIAVSVLPVFAYLAGLLLLDSYKLLKVQAAGAAIAAGCAAAVVCLFANSMLIDMLALEISTYSKYIAPIIEESAKAFYLVFLFRRKYIGFTVDAAILGFAVGAGFAFVENSHYLLTIDNSNMLLWLVRGLGTAVVHSGTVAVFGIISKNLSDRNSSVQIKVFIPGLVVAILVHSAFNHFIFTPVLNTLIIMVAIPLIVIFVFDRSERATREWLGEGMDADMELLESIMSGDVTDTRIGAYLERLRDRFPGNVLADMLCLLRIHSELALVAKGILLAKEVGLDLPRDPEIKRKFEELRFLERSIGKTGRLAILPLVHERSRNLWRVYGS